MYGAVRAIVTHIWTRKVERPPPPLPVRRALRNLADSVSTWRRLRGSPKPNWRSAQALTRMVRRLETADGGVSAENLLRILRALGIQDLMTEASTDAQRHRRLRGRRTSPLALRPKRLSNDG